MRLLDLIEATAAIFCGVGPLVWAGADQSPRQLAIAKIDPVISDDLVDDGRELACGAAAFHLQPVLCPAKVVGSCLKDPEKDDVDSARLLQVKQPCAHLACVEAISTTQIALAGSLGKCFRLLGCPCKA